jgi:hypothetical protein
MMSLGLKRMEPRHLKRETTAAYRMRLKKLILSLRGTAVRHGPKSEPMRDIYCYGKEETTAGWEALGGEASTGDMHRNFQ